MTAIALSEAELSEVRAILAAHLPAGTRVSVFGSRAGGTVKPWSDLDLVFEGTAPLPLAMMAALREGFDESALTWKVDLVDRRSVSEAFGALIDRTAIPLDFTPAPQPPRSST
jgi:predicted nucleotidyltransferase